MKGELRQGKRSWIKLHTLECLEGSIRYQLEPDERGVWYDLLVFSAICRNDGIISDRDGRAFPHSFIANRLNVPLELLERTLKKCREEGRLKENAEGIIIVNWEKYQSEYSRLKKYRVKDEKQARRGVPPERDDEKLEQGWKQDGFGNWYKPTKEQKQSDELVKKAVRQMVDKGG